MGDSFHKSLICQPGLDILQYERLLLKTIIDSTEGLNKQESNIKE